MIEIEKSTTADTRSFDWSKVTKEQLKVSSEQHIEDIKKGMEFFKELIDSAIVLHDFDKLTKLDGFHKDFQTGFEQTEWWDNHRKVNRHHLLADDGIPNNVNLIDVLEMIADCVMAGMGRTGDVYPLEIKPELLKKAFDNTVERLKSQITVKD